MPGRHHQNSSPSESETEDDFDQVYEKGIKHMQLVAQTVDNQGEKSKLNSPQNMNIKIYNKKDGNVIFGSSNEQIKICTKENEKTETGKQSASESTISNLQNYKMLLKEQLQQVRLHGQVSNKRQSRTLYRFEDVFVPQTVNMMTSDTAIVHMEDLSQSALHSLSNRGQQRNWDASILFQTEDQKEGQCSTRFISASAGIGKSFLCEHAAYQWSNDQLWQEYLLVLLIRGRDLNLYENEKLTVKQMIEESLSDACKRDINLSAEEVLEFSKQSKLVVLVDGVDEVKNFPPVMDNHIKSLELKIKEKSHFSKLFAYEFILAMINGKILPGAHIAITTRPIKMPALTHFSMSQGLPFQCVQLLGFNDAQIMLYVHKINVCKFEQEICKEKCFNIIKKIYQNISLKTFCSNPSYCKILINIFQNTDFHLSDSTITNTALITQLIINRINEHSRLPHRVNSWFEDIEEDEKNVLRKICKIASYSVARGEPKLRGTSEKCLVCNSDFIPTIGNVSLSCGTCSKTRNCSSNEELGLMWIEKEYTGDVQCEFEHLILQEYLACAHWVQSGKKLKELSLPLDYKTLSRLIPIMAGMKCGQDMFTKKFIEMLQKELGFHKEEENPSNIFKDILKLDIDDKDEKGGIFKMKTNLIPQCLQKAFCKTRKSFLVRKVPTRIAQILSQSVYEAQITLDMDFVGCEYDVGAMPDELHTIIPILYFAAVQNFSRINVDIKNLASLATLNTCIQYIDGIDTETKTKLTAKNIYCTDVQNVDPAILATAYLNNLSPGLESDRLEVISLASFSSKIWLSESSDELFNLIVGGPKSVDLRSNNLNTRQLSYLFQKLIDCSQDPKLDYLNLKNNDLSEVDTHLLCKAANCLVTLDLTNTQLTASKMEEIRDELDQTEGRLVSLLLDTAYGERRMPPIPTVAEPHFN